MNATQNILPANVRSETEGVFDDTMADFEFGSPAHAGLEVAADRTKDFDEAGERGLRAPVRNSRRNTNTGSDSKSGQREGLPERADLHAATKAVTDADELRADDVLDDLLCDLERQLSILEARLNHKRFP